MSVNAHITFNWAYIAIPKKKKKKNKKKKKKKEKAKSLIKLPKRATAQIQACNGG